MDEYIKKSSVINVIPESPEADYMDEYTSGYRSCVLEVQDAIEDIPAADAVPVVRCKDCRYHVAIDKCCHPDGLLCAKDNDFCSYGERKE